MKKVKVRVSDLPCVATTQGCYVEVECGGDDSGSSDIKALEEKVNTNTTNITALEDEKQDKKDTTLATNAKTVVGAINEVNTTAEVLNTTLVEVKDSLDAKQDIVDNSLATTAKTVPDAINELSTKIDGLGTLVNFKGTVENYADLPTEGVSANDYYFVKNDTTDESGAVTYKKGFYMYCGTHSTWEFITVGVSGDTFVNLTDPQTISGQKTFATTPTTTEQGDLITTSALDLKLSNYVDLTSMQTISGTKTFDTLNANNLYTTENFFIEGQSTLNGKVSVGLLVESGTALEVKKSAEIEGGITIHGEGDVGDYALTTTTALVSDTLTAININATSANFTNTPTVGTDGKEVLVKNTLTAKEIEDTKQNKEISIEGITATTVEGALAELKSSGGGGSSVYNHNIRIYGSGGTMSINVTLNVLSADATVLTWATLTSWLTANGFTYKSSAIYTTYTCSGCAAQDTTYYPFFGCAYNASSISLECFIDNDTSISVLEALENFKFVDTVIKIS